LENNDDFVTKMKGCGMEHSLQVSFIFMSRSVAVIFLLCLFEMTSFVSPNMSQNTWLSIY